jgi:hypothetical protein
MIAQYCNKKNKNSTFKKIRRRRKESRSGINIEDKEDGNKEKKNHTKINTAVAPMVA